MYQDHSALSVREIQKKDIPLIVKYWTEADPEYLKGMGADPSKLPAAEAFQNMLAQQLDQSYEEKQSYCLIWELENEAVGHCNVNKIIYGSEAYMHLHLWNNPDRKKGLGTEFIKLSIPLFFKNLELKIIYSEPYALNPAPNRTLEKAGFTLEKEYLTIPGAINFEQMVKRWQKELK